jgi:DNA-binding transcriptional LysR family regulator
MKNLDWDDIRLFLAVADAGGLSGAVKRGQSSPATLGRRITALERRLSRTLFTRHQSGYVLTTDGKELLALARSVNAGMYPIEAWAEPGRQRPRVRISAGPWTTRFLVADFTALWRPDDAFLVSFHSTERKLDIAHREVDIGIRNHKPLDDGLAIRKIGKVIHGPFTGLNNTASWIGVVPEAATTRALRWANEKHGASISAWADSTLTVGDLIRANAGIGVLPCFVGDGDEQMLRAGPPIEDLSQELWVASHDEDRHLKHIRTVIERLYAVLDAHVPLLAGERPRIEN